MTSRLPGFYRISLEQRRRIVAEFSGLADSDLLALDPGRALSMETADAMTENALGVLSLPVGVATNFLINNRDYLVPMAVEEPSIVASASNVARLVRLAGGFTAKASPRRMIGQIQVMRCPDILESRDRLVEASAELLELANLSRPTMKARGGGALEIDVRIIKGAANPELQMLVVQMIIDTRDAMGANVIDGMMEAISPRVEEISQGVVNVRILSNYTDQCLARARCTLPAEVLGTDELTGEEVRDRIVLAYEFAQSDVYRAVTHNKGIMNGVDAVTVATGNDWRAMEAAAHAFAARSGRYQSLTWWAVDDNGALVGELEMPMAVGVVGGSIGINPSADAALKILRVANASELAEVIVAVGLAQNLAALRALVTDGIQRGHMELHDRARRQAVKGTSPAVAGPRGT